VNAVTPAVIAFVDFQGLLLLTRSAQEVDEVLDVDAVEETAAEETGDDTEEEKTEWTSRRGTGRRRTGNRVDNLRTTRQIRLDIGKQAILNPQPTHHYTDPLSPLGWLPTGITYPGHIAVGVYIIDSDP
jgi:hypothetical protein